MSAASWALQQAVYAALGADSTVKSLIGDPARIFDDVPRDAPPPYIVIGDDSESDWSTATDTGSQHVLGIHVWSRAGGRKEAKLIAGAVRAALDDLALTLDGFTLIDLRFQGADYAREPDGVTYRATLRFRASIEH